MTRIRIARRRAAALIVLPALLATITTANFAEGAQSSAPAKIKLSKSKAKFNSKVRVSGTYVPQRTTTSTTETAVAGGAAPRPANPVVAVRFKKAGAKKFRTIKKVQAGDKGYYSTKVPARRSGKIRTITNDGRNSQARALDVISKTSAKLRDRNAIAGQKVKVTGKVFPTTGGRKVAIKVGKSTYKTRTRSNGTFAEKVPAKSTGKKRVKAMARSNKDALGSSDRAGTLTVFRRAYASWYGPGLYGNRTACGQTLSPGTMGVAHKTMPCGTNLTLRNNGNTVKVEVIDRGPYVHGREFDLTEATKNRLGFGSTGYVLTSR